MTHWKKNPVLSSHIKRKIEICSSVHDIGGGSNTWENYVLNLARNVILKVVLQNCVEELGGKVV